AGISVASVNMPVTFPPWKVNGVIVAGFGAPPDLERAAHPSGFLNAYPDYRIDLDDSVPAVLADGGSGQPDDSMDDDVASYAGSLANMAEARYGMVLDLIRQGHPLVSVVYVGPDRLSHVAWPQVDAILRREGASEGERAIEAYYATLDRLLGETHRAAPDSLLVITSDHGQGPPPPREFAPNAWLAQRGWLGLRAARIRRAGRLVVSSRLRRWLWARWRRARN